MMTGTFDKYKPLEKKKIKEREGSRKILACSTVKDTWGKTEVWEIKEGDALLFSISLLWPD